MHQSLPTIAVQEPSPVEPQFSVPQLAPISEEYPRMNVTQLKHRANRVEQWIEEQKSNDEEHDNDEGSRGGTECHSCLASPQLSLQSIRAEQCDYILVNQETHPQDKGDIPRTPPRSRPKPTSGMFSTPSPLRSFRFSFSPSIRSSASSKPGGHSRGASLSTVDIPRESSSVIPESSPRHSHSPWNVKFRRPSVLGHFSPAIEDATEAEPPRPSTSSNGSYSTRPSIDTPSTVPTTFSLNSTQDSPAHRKSSPSLWSLPSTASHLNDPPGSTKLVSQPSRSTIRVPFSIRTSLHVSENSSNVLTSSRSKRKKKHLVVSGISMNDTPKFEALKRWCESFGEVRSIIRAPNSDIIVDFRKAEVADTVCRVQARVHIAGVGSVGLSWFTGKRP